MDHGVHDTPAPNGADANFCTASYKHLAPNEARAENVSLCRNGIGSLRRRRNVYSHAQKRDTAAVGEVCVMASTHIPLLTERALIFVRRPIDISLLTERGRKSVRCAGMASCR